MVVFNELRMNAGSKAIIIDCHVDELPIYDQMYIKTIELYYYSNADTSGEPKNLEKVYTVYDNTGDDATIREVRKCVWENEVVSGNYGFTTFKDGIFYVRVTCDGTISPDVAQYACGYDDVTDIGLVLDWKTLYDTGMRAVMEMNKCDMECVPKDGFEQFILSWFSIRLALSACDFDALAILWERFLKLNKAYGTTGVSGCGCGR